MPSHKYVTSGAQRVRFKCDVCPKPPTLAVAVGDAYGLRGFEGGTLDGNGGSDHRSGRLERQRVAITERAGPTLARDHHGRAHPDRQRAAASHTRMACHKCGADHYYKRTRLEAAFARAVQRGARTVYVPTDL